MSAEPDIINMLNNPGPAPAGFGEAAAMALPDPKKDLKVAPEKWTDALALQVVVNDFKRAEQYRTQNFDARWTRNDEILHANMDQKYWDGTSVPRASIGVKLEQQQLESLLPHLREGIFQATDGIFFDCFPRPATSQEQATATRELISYQLDDASFTSEFDATTRSMCHHGTGVVKTGWVRQERNRAIWVDEQVPTGFVNVNGQQVPSGWKRKARREVAKETVNRPTVEAVDLRDFYPDPSLRMWDLAKAQFVVQRSLISYDQLKGLGNDPSVKLPPESELREFMVRKQSPTSVAADSYRQQSTAEAGVQGQPVQSSSDPAKWRFEVLEYWTDDRLVTVVERKWVVRNIPNPYGFKPFDLCNYLDVIGQCFGKGLADVLEDEQTLQAGLINSHVDEVSLNIHTGLVVQAGSVINKTQLRPKPAWVIEATSVEAVREIQRTPVTQDWNLALQQSQLRAQQYTGLSDIVTQGAVGVQSSVTRTARGVGALQGAAFSRIQYLIERVEERLIVPMLDKLCRLNGLFLSPDEKVQIVGPNGKLLEFDPKLVKNGSFKFELRAASRMNARAAMASALPEIFQLVTQVIGPMADQGVKTNIPAIMRDALDTLGWRNRNDWFTSMTNEEVQARQQQNQSELVLKAQLQAQRDQARFQANDERSEKQAGLNLLVKTAEKALDGTPAAALSMGLALDASQAGEA